MRSYKGEQNLGRFLARRAFRYSSALAAIILSSGLTLGSTVFAQDWKEPPRKFVDPLGVDMAEVNIPRDDTFLTIGDPSAGGLSWTYHGHYQGLEADYRMAIGSACTDPPPLFSDPTCDPSLDYVLAWIGESATTFGGTGGYANWSGTASTLSQSGTTYIYTEGDGTTYTLNATNLVIKHPNGMKVTVNFPSGSTLNAISNTGFALRFEHGSGDNGTVRAVNTLVHSCSVTSQVLTCAAYDSSISQALNAGTAIGTDHDGHAVASNFDITDRAGKVWSYFIKVKFSYTDPVSHELIRGPRTLWAFRDPTGYAFTTTRAVRGGLTYFTDQRGNFAYSGQTPYQDPSEDYAGTTKDPSGATIYTADMNEGGGNFGYIDDGLGRGTSYGVNVFDHGYSGVTGLPIAPWSQLASVSYPESDYVTYTYDARGNVTSAVKTGKPSSGLSESFTASYPTTCTNQVTCNQPTWTKDAKGNETDYTYDATHGGVLTVTLPADSNSTPLRKKTFNTYTSYNTGDGVIYRLTRSETCGLNSTQLASLTACPTTTSTSVTTTTYFGNTFQPLTVTQTDGANSLSATTTYTYDYIGNVTIVDGPRTDADDKSYKTYDANRRVIYEAGVLPTGLKRTVIHHVYDDAGRELRTELGYENDTTTDGTDFVTPVTLTADINGDSVTDTLNYANSNGAAADAHFVVTSFKRMTYDSVGRLIKTEQVQP